MEVRLKAQNNKSHYETKLAEEKKKVAAIEEVAAVLQEEFQVGFSDTSLGLTDADLVLLGM